jgi:REP element-mobilizing transposase RayT
MPRPLRDEQPGITYHVTAHAVAEARLVRDDGDRERFLAQLQAVAQALGWTCLAVCLLDTHYHLLVTISEANLARGVQRLNGSYAQFFNLKYGRKGHLFGGRYYGGKVLSPAHLLLALRYIARNARDKGADPARYSWSSYPGVIGTRPCWPFIAKARVLELFGSAEVAVRLLRDFIEEEGRPEERGGGSEGSAGVRPRVRPRPP